MTVPKKNKVLIVYPCAAGMASKADQLKNRLVEMGISAETTLTKNPAELESCMDRIKSHAIDFQGVVLMNIGEFESDRKTMPVGSIPNMFEWATTVHSHIPKVIVSDDLAKITTTGKLRLKSNGIVLQESWQGPGLVADSVAAMCLPQKGGRR